MREYRPDFNASAYFLLVGKSSPAVSAAPTPLLEESPTRVKDVFQSRHHWKAKLLYKIDFVHITGKNGF